ncbi:MAG: cobaltochelatase subunit CobT, partial [Gammaproteobacteria bacterium]
MSEQDHPLEPFKRATTATIRAIAGDEELEVSFGQGPPSIRGNRIRVPLPALGADAEEINAVRGMGDEFALRLRFHDDALHQTRSPRGGPAQEMFQWIENARVAAIGSNRMEGVAQNLEASLEVQCQEAAFDSITTEAEAPLSVAVGLLVRQRLTGRELPPSAENVVRFWRDYVEEHAGEDIDRLRDVLLDQNEFADVCRSIIDDLGLLTEVDEPPDSEQDDQDTETVDEGAEADSEFLPEDVVLDDENMADENAEGESTMMEMDADMDMDEMGAEADPDEQPMQLPDDSGRIRVDVNYHAYTEEFDETIRAEELCESDEMIRLRALLDQQLIPLQHATSKLANRLQRKLMAIQNRTWEYDLEEGLLDTSRLTQVIIDPMNPLAFEQEKEM